MSMARLHRMQGNSNHTQLAEIYSTFTEGFDTPDLKQAKALLDTADNLTAQKTTNLLFQFLNKRQIRHLCRNRHE